MEFVWLVIGLAVGAAVGYLFAFKSVFANNNHKEETDKLIEEKSRAEGELVQFKTQIEQYAFQLSELRQKNQDLIQGNSQKETSIQHLRENIAHQEKNLETLQQQFKLEFENMANKIFEEKSQKFAHQNKENLGLLLTPFSDRIKTFEDAIRLNQHESTKERTSLKEQILQLTDLNQQMRSDAQNLTKALKGDNKTQGNWGEFILERILEESGLIKDKEYFTQYSDTNAEGHTVRPDVVINLPEEKHLIIDSKVSLLAYEQHISAEDEDTKTRALRLHIDSLKAHIKGLSDKNYHSAVGLNTPEFVLLFIPIESSFSLAIQADNALYKYAWERKVVIVSPSTLLATLRTISSVWKQERQTKNAIEIARQAGGLYDKFVGFIADLQNIKKRLDQGHEAYDAALNKLQTGRGNIINSTEKLRKLGAKVSKAIPEDLLENADDLPPAIE